jgi:hypothetical protein
MKELYKALADFQQECPTIAKAGEAKVQTKSGGNYSYHYADLPSIVELINPLMKKHKLGFIQPLRYTDGVRKVATIIFHTETGHSIESEIDIPEVTFVGMNDYQSLGSGITYLRRYSLSSALGIVTDEDNDATGEQIKGVKKELPWLTQKQFESSVKRIQDANPSVHITEDGNDLELTPDEFLEKLTSGFRMKKEFKENLKTEIEFQKTLLNAPERPQDIEPELI